jgi:hypothetical protein
MILKLFTGGNMNIVRNDPKIFFSVFKAVIFMIIISNNNFVLKKLSANNIIKERFNPFIIELDRGESSILYYGSFHNIDISHPQFNDIENKWNRFKPDIAYSEGEIWPLIKSKAEAIKKYGEQGLLRYLAYRDNIKIKCIEPTRKKEIQYLKKYYPLIKVKIFYVLRQLVIDKEILKKNINNKYVRFLLSNNRSFCIYSLNKRVPRTVLELNIKIKKLLPEIKDWRKIDSRYFMDTRKPGNWLAKMNILVNKYRDIYMVKKIIKELKNGKKIFAVVGKSHVVKQEKTLLEKINKI